MRELVIVSIDKEVKERVSCIYR